jgi:hypothetical protein
MQTSVDPPTLSISRGGINRRGVDFGVNFALSHDGSSVLFASVPGGDTLSAVGATGTQPQAPSTARQEGTNGVSGADPTQLPSPGLAQDLPNTNQVAVDPYWPAALATQVSVDTFTIADESGQLQLPN